MKYNTVQLEVIFKVKVHWINPPKDKLEEIEREQAQLIIDVECDKMARDGEKYLFDTMVAKGAIKPIEEVDKEDLL